MSRSAAASGNHDNWIDDYISFDTVVWLVADLAQLIGAHGRSVVAVGGALDLVALARRMLEVVPRLSVVGRG